MTTENQKTLQNKISTFLQDCKGSASEDEHILNLRLTLKKELKMRDVLIDRYFNNYYA